MKATQTNRAFASGLALLLAIVVFSGCEKPFLGKKWDEIAGNYEGECTYTLTSTGTFSGDYSDTLAIEIPESKSRNKVTVLGKTLSLVSGRNLEKGDIVFERVEEIAEFMEDSYDLRFIEGTDSMIYSSETRPFTSGVETVRCACVRMN